MLKEPPSHVSDSVTAHVLSDLEPSLTNVHLKVGIAALVGGFLSLMICGQYGLSVTNWAEALNHRLHSHLSPVSCALACGLIHALFPVAVLRLMTPPLQFRAILRRHQFVLMSWLAGSGAVLAFFGEYGQGVIEYAAWVVAALLAANGCARLVNLLLPRWNPRESSARSS